MTSNADNGSTKVAVIGLGSMGLGMAGSLLRAGFVVSAYDTSEKSCLAFAQSGGTACRSAQEAAVDASAVVCVVVNASQTEDVLFGPQGIAGALPRGAVIISCATMAPADAINLSGRAAELGLHYIDAPISGGAIKAASGELTVMASGPAEAFSRADPVLAAMAAKIYRLGECAGIGASIKMINQLLAGVHIAAACEAIGLASKLGLDLRTAYDVITASAGNSWMFENRVPHILAGDYRPLSSVEIFVKDLGIIQDMARAERFPAPMAAAALQLYLATAGVGMGQDDDSSLARLYASLSGASLPPVKIFD